jgi:2-oxo-4-hydroxy-4-carboxy-5-ureidoimidazoline decarboxylase
MTLAELNALDERAAAELFERCCGSRRWVHQMVAARPFSSYKELLQQSEMIWKRLSAEDWKEAFSHHPKIGDLESLQKKFASTASWAAHEQSGVRSASDETLRRLAEGNRLYEQRFGYIFIVHAAGKSAEEMLALLEARLHHLPEEELPVAAAEQERITRLRLTRAVADSTP